MLNLQEWNQRPSTMFLDSRIHERTVFIAQGCMRFPTGTISERFESSAAAEIFSHQSL